jgi:amino acid adenylation domain-containing protein
MRAVTETNGAASDSARAGEDERFRLFALCNDTRAEYPRDSLAHRLFEARVERNPESIAVVFEDTCLSYRELNDRANRLARRLRAAAVGPSSLAGIFVERSIELVVSLLGILKAGGAYVPLDPSYPKDRLAFMIEDARLSALVTEQRLIGEMPAHESQVICVDADLEEAPRSDDENLACTATPENPAYVIYTSGSTGRPKGVQIPHRALVNFLTSMERRPGLTEKETLLSVTTISFDIAALEIFLPLVAGARLVIVSREVASDGARLGRAIERSGATILQATPATWRLLLGAGWQGDGRLRLFCGGEALPLDLARSLLARGACLWNLYGPTETTIWSSAFQVRAEAERIFIGRPIANTEIYLLDERLDPVPVGEAGELYIGGDGLAIGYLDRPELTAEKFIPHPYGDEPGARLYRTGDLARYTPEGDLECLGRIDHQVKIRGHRVELGEIEAALREHPSVRESVVVAREDGAGDKRLAAYVVVGEDNLSFRARVGPELQEMLGKRLPGYMTPSAFVVLDALPLTPNGKVDRSALPAPGPSRAVTDRLLVAPRDPLEEQLVQIWEEVLNVCPVGIRDNFFELGGHSLLAARMMNEVEQACGRKLPLDTLYEEATIEALANLLLEQEDDRLRSAIVEVQAGGPRRPFFFLHGDYTGGGFYCLNLARRLDRDQPFYVISPHGADGGRIPQSIEEMARCRLETLRGLQARGPYLLGGFCNGGLVAFEMARQLEKAGERVDLLAVVYALARNTRLGIIQSVVSGFDRLFGLDPDRQLEHFLFLRSRIARSKRALSRYAERLGELSRAEPDEQIAFIQNGAKTIFGKPGLLQQAQYQNEKAGLREVSRWDMTAKYNRLMQGYVPRRYKGRITLFWPEGVIRYPDDPTMGWGRVTSGGVDLYPIPGRHLTCITRHADVLAERLNACLHEAQAKSESSPAGFCSRRVYAPGQ